MPNVWPAPFTGSALRNEFSERWRRREAELLQHPAAEPTRRAEARVAGNFATAVVIECEAEALIAGASNRHRVSRP